MTKKKLWYNCTRAIIHGDKGLLVLVRVMKHPVTGKEMKLLQVPGGGIDVGETPWEGMLRELNEELQVKTQPDFEGWDKVRASDFDVSYAHSCESSKTNEFQDAYIRKFHGFGPEVEYRYINSINWFAFDVSDKNIEFGIGDDEKTKFEHVHWVDCLGNGKPNFRAIEELAKALGAFVSSEIIDLFYEKSGKPHPYAKHLAGPFNTLVTEEVGTSIVSLQSSTSHITTTDVDFLAVTSVPFNWDFIKKEDSSPFPPHLIDPGLKRWLDSEFDLEAIKKMIAIMPYKHMKRTVQSVSHDGVYYLRVYKSGGLNVLKIERSTY